MSRVFRREVADDRTLGRTYGLVVQVVILYGLEMWVFISRIGRFWGVFHHRMDRKLTAIQHWRVRDNFLG